MVLENFETEEPTERDRLNMDVVSAVGSRPARKARGRGFESQVFTVGLFTLRMG